MVPPDTELSARPAEIQAWDDVADDLKPVLARQMEVYAGFLEHTDHHIGRLIDALEELGVLDDTLVYHIIGDNGASAEGTPNGTFNEIISLNGAAAVRDHRVHGPAHRRVREARGLQPLRGGLGPRHGHPLPVDQAGGLPLRRHPQRDHRPLAQRVQAKGEVRSQFHHIIDVAATILDAAGLPEPTFVNGIQQMPLHGVSMRYAFDHADAPERRETQYFEVACNRGIYHKGWTAVTRHSTPWDFGAELPALDDDVWELYDTTTDWSQAHDLAAEHPDKLKELQRLWLIEAVKYNVLPLDDRRIERFNSDIAGRPVLVKGKTQLLYGGMIRLSENSVLNLKNKSHSVTAEIEVPDGGASGVIIAQGGAFAGWSLYLHQGKPKYCHNLAGLMRFYVEGDRRRPARHPPGAHGVRLRRRRTGQGRHGVPLHRRQASRRRAHQRHRAHDLLRRRDLRRRPRHRHPGQRGLHQRDQPASPGPSTGSSSTSATTATTTSSPPKSSCGSPPPSSSRKVPTVTVGDVPESCCTPSREQASEPGRPQQVVEVGVRRHPSLVAVPPGRYRMGDESDWSYAGDGEGPVHDIGLPAFQIDRVRRLQPAVCPIRRGQRVADRRRTLRMVVRVRRTAA